jgi:hypothetical protein
MKALMFRTIAAAAIVFAFSVFALQHSPMKGPLSEPILLLFMGALFLVVGKLSQPRPRVAGAALPATRR